MKAESMLPGEAVARTTTAASPTAAASAPCPSGELPVFWELLLTAFSGVLQSSSHEAAFRSAFSAGKEESRSEGAGNLREKEGAVSERLRRRATPRSPDNSNTSASASSTSAHVSTQFLRSPDNYSHPRTSVSPLRGMRHFPAVALRCRATSALSLRRIQLQFSISFCIFFCTELRFEHPNVSPEKLMMLIDSP